MPEVGGSLVRLLGAFALVMALALGALWLVRRGVRFPSRGGGSARKLNVLEVRVLGNRQSVFVVGYEGQRLLLASGPAGVTFLTHLPPASAGEAEVASTQPSLIPNFAEALQQAFGKSRA